jgi:hypothetical protein
VPVFRFGCETCGVTREELVTRGESVTCACGKEMAREFTPGATLRLASWLRPEAEQGRARQKAWMETPEVQAKLRSGAYQIDTSNRHNDNSDGDAMTSSVLARAKQGRSLSV